MKKPYLIQRIIERQEESIPKTQRDLFKSFDDYFICDYMGSAEFEFGALPNSLKEFTKAKDLSYVKFEKVQNSEGQNLYVIAALGINFAYDYFEAYMEKLIFDEIRLKERSGLQKYVFGGKSYSETTIW